MVLRRQLLVVLGTASLWPAVALSAEPKRTYRIGFLIPPREAGARPFVDGFLLGLRELGYVEGKNVRIDFVFADDDLSRLPGLAQDMVRRGPDVIVTASPPGVRAVMQATRAIPIVIAAVYDPVGQGFVSSLARPGGNVTGLSVQYEDTIPKLLELATALLPGLKTIAVVHTADPSHDNFIARIMALTQPMNIAVQPVAVQKASELESAFAGIGRTGGEALMVLPHPLFNTRPGAMVQLAETIRVPAIYPFRNYAEAGGLMSLGIDIPDSFRRAAYFVHRILQGAKPADLPVEQPSKIDLVLNLKTAKALGLTVPRLLLMRADRVIE